MLPSKKIRMSDCEAGREMDIDRPLMVKRSENSG
jgi:hypothetical protein